jgi:hypothetical protein
MQPAPLGVTLLVLTDQDTEAHASATVTLVAELMEAEDFGLPCILGEGWGRHERAGKDGNRKSSQGRSGKHHEAPFLARR